MRVLGIDLAWGAGTGTAEANETGLVAVDLRGRVVDAGWAHGVDEVLSGIDDWAEPDTLAMIDAPLVVENPSGQRRCETEVGQRYGRWKVSANSTNLGSPRLAGVDLRQRLEERDWTYDDGRHGPPDHGWVLSEVYPLYDDCRGRGAGLRRRAAPLQAQAESPADSGVPAGPSGRLRWFDRGS